MKAPKLHLQQQETPQCSPVASRGDPVFKDINRVLRNAIQNLPSKSEEIRGNVSLILSSRIPLKTRTLEGF
ncbi:hypothetical protein AM1_B0098 (plasmid) [Acaryochloris marina MBIC11017]|uniref:Uncharacterized protein n=1 Tax=Acaryochloris marina (strain MBIC 11017) TaxID=329726 RepID=A8ZM55_ACAM1|nr:hypothetical protein AM1_B0098 [Acaryochloris marina MBIC11017]